MDLLRCSAAEPLFFILRTLGLQRLHELQAVSNLPFHCACGVQAAALAAPA